MGSEMVSVDGVLHVKCPKCGFLNLTGVCACSYKPTPPAPAMPEGLCSFCGPENKGWGTKAVAEATRLDLKRWSARLQGKDESEIHDTHGLDYLTVISHLIGKELTTLRQRLAEAEKSRDTARGVADAFRDTISRATRNPDAVHGLMMLCESHEKHAKCEAEKARLVSAMTKENERVAADAARWEGAARKIAEMYKAFRLCSMYTRTMDEHDADLTRAIAAEKAVDLDPTASALVREGGGAQS